MDTILVPFISVLLGAIIGGFASLSVETSRARNERRAALLTVRREVQLDALEEVHRTIVTFRTVFSYNHTGDDEEADAAQAEALDRHFDQLDSLELRAHRVDVLASHKVAALVREVPDEIRSYFEGLDMEERVFRAVDVDAVSARLKLVLMSLKNEVRLDLRTAELDGRG